MLEHFHENVALLPVSDGDLLALLYLDLAVHSYPVLGDGVAGVVAAAVGHEGEGWEDRSALPARAWGQLHRVGEQQGHASVFRRLTLLGW